VWPAAWAKMLRQMTLRIKLELLQSQQAAQADEGQMMMKLQAMTVM
jgi:hypothetical protein